MESAILEVKNELEKKLLEIKDFKYITKSCRLTIIKIINYLESKNVKLQNLEEKRMKNQV
jgi:hypothetical protein